MATDTSIEVTVRLDHAGYKTKSVQGQRGSCTYNAEVAVKRLAEKLYPDYQTTVERLECVAVGRLHSKWRIKPGDPHVAAK